MKTLEVPFLACLRKKEIAPSKVFDDLDALSGVTFTLSAEGETNDQLMANPNPDHVVTFTINANGKQLQQVKMKMSKVFETTVKLEWHDQGYKFKFK